MVIRSGDRLPACTSRVTMLAWTSLITQVSQARLSLLTASRRSKVGTVTLYGNRGKSNSHPHPLVEAARFSGGFILYTSNQPRSDNVPHSPLVDFFKIISTILSRK